MPNKLERFTQRARRVLSLAQEEAERFNHSYIGTEHVLLGLMREEGGVAGRVLRDLGLEQARVEELAKQLSLAGERAENTTLDLSPGTKRVLELGVDEARRMGHHYIGTEHLLLGLVRQSEGTAIDILKRLGVSPDEVRRQTRRVLQEAPVQPNPPASGAESAQAMRPITSPAFEPQLHSRLLIRLLSHLAESLDDTEKRKMEVVINELFDEVITVKTVPEDTQNRLLQQLIAPFRPADESKRKVRVVISDKTSGETYADIKMPVDQAREGMRSLMQALLEGKTGTLLDINDDDNNHIVISIEG